MFRATVDTDVDGSVVRMAGQLTVEFLKDVERLCISAEPPVLIDANGLRSCDADGLAFLARMRDGAVRVEGLSKYLEMRIRYVRTEIAGVSEDSGSGHDGPGPGELA